MPQRVGHRVLAFSRGQFQNLHVHSVGHLLRVSAAQRVVSEPEHAGGKHLLAVFVIRKGSRLADQRINDVTIINRHQFLTRQSRHRLNEVALVSHRDLLGPDPDIHLLSNQPAGNRIRVGPHLNGAAFADAQARQLVVGLHPFGRQCMETGLLFEETLLPIRIGPADQVFNKLHVVLTAGEVPTATQ